MPGPARGKEAPGARENAPHVRRAIAESLDTMGKGTLADAVPLLATLLTAEPDKDLRQAVAAALDQLAAEARPAPPAVRRRSRTRRIHSLPGHAHAGPDGQGPRGPRRGTW